MGTVPVIFNANYKPVLNNGMALGNITDQASFVNILPFGMCKRPPFPVAPLPCTPLITSWLLPSVTTRVMQMPLLKKGAIGVCPIGCGIIKFKMCSFDVKVNK